MSANGFIKADLQGSPIRSLTWVGDELIDFAGGFRKISSTTGAITHASVNYAYPFDAVTTTADGQFAALYQRFGTKCLLLSRGQIVRELNRSFYHANAYEYPIAFLNNGTDPLRIIHCPDEYNILQIEDFETGEIVTWKDDKPTDFFHSRLSASPDNRWLLSAGWIWHPLDSIELFDLSQTPYERYSPSWTGNIGDVGLWEFNNATFLPNSTLLLSGTGDEEQEDASDAISIVAFDLGTMSVKSKASIETPTGSLFPVSDSHALAFYDFPRLLNVNTGAVIQSWPMIATDKRNSSIGYHDIKAHIAVDAPNQRFAVATDEAIFIVNIDAMASKGA